MSYLNMTGSKATIRRGFVSVHIAVTRNVFVRNIIFDGKDYNDVAYNATGCFLGLDNGATLVLDKGAVIRFWIHSQNNLDWAQHNPSKMERKVV